MSTPINHPFSLDGSAVIIPMNRWGMPRYTLQIETGAGTVVLAGTTAKINQGQTAVWATLDDAAGVAISGQGVGIVEVAHIPVEAMRVTATGVVTGRLIQQGDSS